MTQIKLSSRRQLLRMGAALGGGMLAAQRKAFALDTPGKLGIPLGPYGERSPFEKAVRWRRESKTPETGSSFTPLQDSVGTLTPSSLHYERHHAGIPTIDPATHRLVIHGSVDRPLSLSMAEIRRLPSLTRTLVLECGGNSAGEWAAGGGADVQRSYGLVSCSEWTGVPLSLGRRRRPAQRVWVIAPRRRVPDGARVHSRKRWTTSCSPMGRTARRFVRRRAIRCADHSRVEGSTNVKWLHSLKLTDQPYGADETANARSDAGRKDADLHLQMEAKSVITFRQAPDAARPGL